MLFKEHIGFVIGVLIFRLFCVFYIGIFGVGWFLVMKDSAWGLCRKCKRNDTTTAKRHISTLLTSIDCHL